MASHTHHTKEPDTLRWEREVISRLPADLEQQARRLGAFQRRREFDCAASLLRGLLAYALVASSLAHLAAWGVLSAVADIGAAAWLRRLRAAYVWLAWPLGEILAVANRPVTLRHRADNVFRCKWQIQGGKKYNERASYKGFLIPACACLRSAGCPGAVRSSAIHQRPRLVRG